MRRRVESETKISAEGVKSTHTQQVNGSVDVLIQVPVLKVRQKVNGQQVEEIWPRVGDIYLPVVPKKG